MSDMPDSMLSVTQKLYRTGSAFTNLPNLDNKGRKITEGKAQMNNWLEEYEKELAEKNAAELAKYDSAEEVAKREVRRKEEFEKGVRLGWWNEDGDPLESDEDAEDEDEDEDDKEV